jgi:ArsR family transcriptional regulator, nickel/cobalt-responsive transcriptional repressor
VPTQPNSRPAATDAASARRRDREAATATLTPTPDRDQRIPEATALRVADTMFALSTPSRLQILVALRSGPRTVSQIVDAVGMEQSAVSHQLRVLRDNSLLSMQRVGRTRLYALRNDYTAALIDAALAHVRELERAS